MIHSTARRSLQLLVIIAVLALPACSDEPLPESTQAATTAQPTTSTTTTAPPPTTSSAPATTAATTTAAATTTTAIPSEPSLFVVPAGIIPEIDGVLAPGEWTEAAIMPMSDGASLYLQHADEVLYVAVAGDEVGAVNVIIGTESEVQILHSSAALGSARYVPTTSVWSLDHGFSWCCRRGSTDTARATLFAEEGWDANIGYAGDPGIVEYAIAIPWADAAMAVSSIRRDDDTGFFPSGLTAEAQSQLLGVPPAENLFNTNEWARLEVGS